MVDSLARRLFEDDFATGDFFNDFMTSRSGYGLPSGVRYETKDDELVVSFDVPGINPDDVSATVQNNILTVTGKTGERSYTYRIRVRNVNTDNAEHTLEHGVLTLTFPRAEHLKERNLLAK